MKPQIELLAPAGSRESMIAAINAGADAVYMGGSRFGARAYADNLEEDGFLKAIDYAHLHGCRLYMTVNTLVKEEELEEVSDFLAPYYWQGLDAAIVQDLGVLSLIRESFPDLAVHISTQATVTGYRSAKLFQKLGASRIVTARELSLEEIARIRDEVDIEIESFVHGALCYCYSGQCLLSSLIGGRSGNRGRCAQPCRLPYNVEDGRNGRLFGDGKKKSQMAGEYAMNLKDLCTLDILPDILEAGVDSLKIEGRMKSPRYTAGVVSVYRKYVDYYLKNGRAGYQVDPADKRMLLELFDRGGFTKGYYQQHNGREMISLKGKPRFRETDSLLFDSLDQKYVNPKKQEAIDGILAIREGEPASLILKFSGGCDLGNETKDDKKVVIKVKGNPVQTAKNQPLSKERLGKQLNKTGGTPFYFRNLEVKLTGNCFVSVQELNDLRRRGLEELERRILEEYRRKKSSEIGKNERRTDKANMHEPENSRSAICEAMACEHNSSGLRLHVSLEEPEGLQTVAKNPDVDEIYLDACGFPAESWQRAVNVCHDVGKQCALILPHIFRERAEQYFMTHIWELKKAGFDELILRSLEEMAFLQEYEVSIPVVLDGNLYGMNRRACEVMMATGAARLTLPLELNRQELAKLGCRGKELLGYGYLPAMVSAQCVQRTFGGCTQSPETLFIKDRTGKRLPVKNHCPFCYNTIYNPDPLSLLGLEQQIRELEPAVLRLSFTIEKPQQIQEILQVFGEHFRRGKDTPAPFKEFTRGHFKRKVE